jgi:hypothetical protein
MKMTPYKPADVSRVLEAIVILRQARQLLDGAGAWKTAERVRLALSSAYGARRHVLRRQYRASLARRAA